MCYVENRISVIIPIYGDFDSRRAVLSIESILSQRKVDFEIIVSEEGKCPRLKSLLTQNIIYTFKQQNLSDCEANFNPGAIRASAIELSSGEYIYTNDADIVFLNDHYLFKSLELMHRNPRLVLQRPPMRRLPLDNFETFWETSKKANISIAMSQLDYSQNFLATTDKVLRPLKVVTQTSETYTKTFTTSIDLFTKYITDPSLKGKEPTIWAENLHCGGILVRKLHYDAVGGYCKQFLNWGCEDSDLQWKLTSQATVEFFPACDTYEVLHLDHPKHYFSPEMWKRNELICEQRKSMGIDASIKMDIAYDSKKRTC